MKKEELLIQTADVKVRIIELQVGESGPVHHHTEITDNMFGLSGEIIVSLQNPTESVTLTPGVRCRIEPGRRHSVSNNHPGEPSSYLLVQGVGSYDFIE